MDTVEQDLAKGRILKIYKYLQALDQLRNPVTRDLQIQPWNLYFKDLPHYSTIEQGQFENSFSDSNTNSDIDST